MIRPRTAKILFGDLVGLPYVAGGSSEEGCDCIGIGRMALERMGAPLEEGDLPVTEGDLWANIERLIGDESSPWEEVGSDSTSARLLGDMLLSQTPDGAHVAVLVDEVRKIALTACPALYAEDGEMTREGRTFACAARRIPGVVGVYRLKRWGESR